MLCALLSILVETNGDETVYTSAATSAARGLLVYKDFPYHQGPVLPYIYGLFAYLGAYELWHFRLITSMFLFFSIVISIMILNNQFLNEEMKGRDKKYLLYIIPVFYILSINCMAMSTRLSTKEAVTFLMTVSSLYFLTKRKFSVFDGLISIMFGALLFGIKLTYLTTLSCVFVLCIIRLFVDNKLNYKILLFYFLSTIIFSALFYIPVFIAYNHFVYHAIKIILLVYQSDHQNNIMVSMIKGGVRELPSFVVNHVVQFIFIFYVFVYSTFNIKTISVSLYKKDYLRKHFLLLSLVVLLLAHICGFVLVQNTINQHRWNILYPIITLLASYSFIHFRFYDIILNFKLLQKNSFLSIIISIIMIFGFIQLHNIYGVSSYNWNSRLGAFLMFRFDNRTVKEYLENSRDAKYALAVGYENIANNLGLRLAKGSGDGLSIYRNIDFTLEESRKYGILTRRLLRYYLVNNVCDLIIFKNSYYDELLNENFFKGIKYNVQKIGKDAVRITVL
jgi:hypothetical protein